MIYIICEASPVYCVKVNFVFCVCISVCTKIATKAMALSTVAKALFHCSRRMHRQREPTLQCAYRALTKRVTTSNLTINCTGCCTPQAHVSVSKKCHAESGPRSSGSTEWVRWEGGVLGSNQAVFSATAPVNIT